MQTDEEEVAQLAAVYGDGRERLVGALAGETVQAALTLVPRWRWFKRWRLGRMLKQLVREEIAHRGD